MGYHTEFKGELKFTRDLKASELAEVSKFLGEDCRDHPEWKGTEDLTYIDLELTPDYSGLQWNDGEKTYNMDKLVNVIIRNMRELGVIFGLTGRLVAQGEECDDRWELIIGDHGLAQKKEVAIIGKKIMCPNCEEYFVYEGE